MNIFVGNLSSQTSESQLRTLFAEFGEVKSVNIVMDKFTNHSRGFGVVEMAEKASGEKAIDKLNNTSVNLQSIVVNEAKPRTERSDNSRNNRRY